MAPYQFAWPAGLSTTVFYPTFNEISSGAAGGLNQGVAGTLPPGTSSSVSWPNTHDESREEAPARPRDYGSYALSDLDYVARTPPVPSSPPVIFTPEPTFSYEYRGFPPTPTVAKDPDNAVYPGEVISGGGDSYQVKIYKKGLSGKSTTIPAKQLQIASGDDIPAGVKCMVVMLKNSKGEQQYYIQVPVWIPEE